MYHHVSPGVVGGTFFLALAAGSAAQALLQVPEGA